MDIYIPGAPIPPPPKQNNPTGIPQQQLRTLKPAKHHGVVWALFLIVVIVVSVVYFMPQVLGILFGRDSAKPNISGLNLDSVLIPYAQNGFFNLSQIKDGDIYEPNPNYFRDLTIYPDSPSYDQAQTDSIISKNQQILSSFDAAASKPHFQVPDYSEPDKINFTTQDYPMDSWVQAAKLKALQVLSLAKQNQPQQAAAAALSIIRLGYNIQNSQGLLSEYLAGMQIKNTGYNALLSVLSSSGFSSKDIRSYISENYGYTDNFTGLKNALLAEYYRGANTADLIASGKSAQVLGDPKAASNPKHNIASKANNKFYFKPNETKTLFADYVQKQLKDSDRLCSDQDIFNNISYAVPTKYELIGMFTSNVVGKYLFQSQALSFGSLQKARCQQDMLSQVVSTMLGLKAYKVDYKTLPEKITELTPNYLITMPSDVYDSNVLRFNKAKQIIYSVGPSGQDTGGSTGPDWTKMQNPTFNINF